ncbi:T9SS type A sorting domain-containing protein [Kaistella flava (ex Peng et al. 2021)]|uniref:T9SS type A sorting domain-containing protein n=1 Tax=Kaistella flava (ex Peng et al. 2021) TaxID=2038776 RepID=A0A7M2YBN1_9FLAO|nr:T9SS type A sorting domain-containing protein [Kaistella flava (ex Peng et al. 2021)]QOW11658.1 T9SS type A sorting domain-containing protein [Kaistella flava (ex Peng et al. 2021)]
MKNIYLLLSLFFLQATYGQDTFNAKFNVQNFSASSSPRFLIENNGDLLFSASRSKEFGGNELYSLNTTTDKSKVIKSFVAQNFTSIKSNLVKFNGKIYFIATNYNELNNQLWESDGTAEGTKLVKHLYNSSSSYSTIEIKVSAEKMFLIIDYKLWSSDGTDVGTLAIGDTFYGSEYYILDGKLFYWQNNYDADTLMVSDGTVMGTKPFKIFQKTSTENYSNFKMVKVGSNLYFVARSNNAVGLWKTDGTIDGTVFLNTVNALTLNGVLFNDELFFYTKDNKLWKSGGTAQNTILVKDIPQTIETIFVFKNAIYLDTTTNFIKSDGTAENTQPHQLGDNDASLSYLTKSDKENFLFLKSSIQYTNEIYITTGNEIANRLNTGTVYGNSEYLEIGNYIYYRGNTRKNGDEIFKYNITDKTEKITADVNFGFSSNPFGYETIGDNLFFTAVTDNNSNRQIFTRKISTGEEKQVTNLTNTWGEQERTLVVGDYYYSFSNSYIYKSDGTEPNSHFFSVNKTILDVFKFNDSTLLYLARSEGKLGLYKLENSKITPELILENINAPYISHNNGAILNNKLYFVFYDENQHLAIYSTDGTTANTVKKIEFPYDNLQSLKILGVVNEKLIFSKSANINAKLFDVYSYDETLPTPTLIKSFTDYVVTFYAENYKDKLYFLADNSALYHLYNTDGTASGTKFIRSLTLSTYGNIGIQKGPKQMFTKCGNSLFILGQTLWRTDGETAGTYEISKNIYRNDITCHQGFLYGVYYSDSGYTPGLFRTNGVRNQNKHVTFNITASNTDVLENYNLLNAVYSNVGSDGTSLYFTGYNNKSEYHQYIVNENLPVFLNVENNSESHINNIIIAPNPVSNYFSAQTKNLEKLTKVQIVDLSGKIVREQSKNFSTISVVGLPSSIYYVKIFTTTSLYVEKIIKN